MTLAVSSSSWVVSGMVIRSGRRLTFSPAMATAASMPWWSNVFWIRQRRMLPGMVSAWRSPTESASSASEAIEVHGAVLNGDGEVRDEHECVPLTTKIGAEVTGGDHGGLRRGGPGLDHGVDASALDALGAAQSVEHSSALRYGPVDFAQRDRVACP